MKKELFLGLVFLVTLSSCSSLRTVKSCKKIPFREIDSLEGVSLIRNFTISKPRSFVEVKKSTGPLHYQLLDSNENSVASIDVDFIKARKVCENQINLDSYLQHVLERITTFEHSKFQYSLLKSKHKKYGDLYLISYKSKRKKIYENVIFLFFHNNYGYSIKYSSVSEKFKRYLSEVEQSIQSFTIIN